MGDAAKGKQLYIKICKDCHNIAKHDKHWVGPNLYGVVDHRAGSASGYQYSEALKFSEIVWTKENLHGYLEDPEKFLPGTTMIIPGVKSVKRREDIIAFLEKASKE